jgi:hypothetical protein
VWRHDESFALFEQALLRAKAIGGATPPSLGADSVALTVDGTAPLRFKVDARGRIQGGRSGNTGAIIARAP